MSDTGDIYRALFDLLPDSLVILQKGQYQLVNAAFTKQFGYSPEDVERGLSFLELVSEGNREAVLQRYNDRMAGKKLPRTFQADLISKDGVAVPTETSAALITYKGEPADLVLIRDISERKELEATALNTHLHLDATLNALPDLLFEADWEGRIHDYRAPDSSVLYRRPESFVGKKVSEVLPKSAAKIIMQTLKKVSTKGRCLGDSFPLWIDGKKHWFELSAAVKGDLSGPKGRAIVLSREITDRKNSEEQLQETLELLRVERVELSEKNVALKQILEHIEGQKSAYRTEVWADLEASVVPLVRKLKKKVAPGCLGEFEELETCLNQLMAKDVAEFDRRFASLTSRESELCEMIKAGMSSKQIAKSLNLSVATIHKHREHIRNKLGVAGKSISLPTYLRSH